MRGGGQPPPPPPKEGREEKKEGAVGGVRYKGYYGCKSMYCYVVVLEVEMRPKVLLLKIVFGRWGEKASHDRCVNNGKEVKELYLYPTSLS